MLLHCSELIFKRELSFFSQKSISLIIKSFSVSYFCLRFYSAAQIIKESINPPKKSPNSYAVFYQEKYPEFKSEGNLYIFIIIKFFLKSSDLKMTEVSKVVGNKWKELSSDQKAVF